jgi:hypothetical protein
VSERAVAPERLAVTTRVVISAALAGWGAFITYFSLIVAPQHLAKDFTWPWRAARVLLEGNNPYTVMQATGPYPFNVGLFYPLTAAIATTPFAPFSPAVAGTLFFALSAGLLAFGLTATRDGLVRLPMFASAPFCMAAVLCQWAPLITAAALLPALQFLCTAKPNLGLVAWIYRPSVKGAIAAAAFILVSIILMPHWPFDWRQALTAAPRYKGPVFRGLVGLILLAGALRWRRREGRLFLAMALTPQLSLFYDQLPLWLVPNTVWRTVALSAVSWIAWWQWYPSRALKESVAIAEPWVFWLVYVPALVLLLLLPPREATASPADERPADAA